MMRQAGQCGVMAQAGPCGSGPQHGDHVRVVRAHWQLGEAVDTVRHTAKLPPGDKEPSMRI
jgi:hypothetical protein